MKLESTKDNAKLENRNMTQELIHHFQKIYIDEKSAESSLAKRFYQLFPKEKIELVSSAPYANIKGDLTAEQFERSKKELYIKPFDGAFFKRCPGSAQKKTLNCCNYYVLNLGSQCNMNCSYCYLQSYLKAPVMMMYSNVEQALQELEDMAEQHPDLPYRVGTGEVIDSLSLDPLSLFSRDLIAFFKKYPKWTLEFKTKSDKVDQFLDCEHAGNIVVSWSINAQSVITAEEHGTASLEARLQAAEKCVAKGYQIAFHIDPLIYHPNWKQNYQQLLDQVQSRFRSSDVNVISVGALRFQPEQRHLMRERFGMKSYVAGAEMFPSEGAKLRYDFHLRNEMFDFVLNSFKQHDPKWKIFLCMETPETWISAYDKTPMQMEPLKDYFRPLPKISRDEIATAKA